MELQKIDYRRRAIFKNLIKSGLLGCGMAILWCIVLIVLSSFTESEIIKNIFEIQNRYIESFYDTISFPTRSSDDIPFIVLLLLFSYGCIGVAIGIFISLAIMAIQKTSKLKATIKLTKNATGGAFKP